MPSNKDVFWVRQDVFGNRISFYMATWNYHAEKHAYDKIPTTPEHIYQAIIDPDFAHRSLVDVIGPESCIFEKFFQAEQQSFFVPVLYEGVTIPGEYDRGGKTGKVLTGYFLDSSKPSNMIGEIFWSKAEEDEKDETK